MGKIEQVQKQMMLALKQQDTERKEALSLLLSALKAKAKDKRAELTEEEENAVIFREIKQMKETMESAPPQRTDIIQQCKLRLDIFGEFAPKMMGEDEIRALIRDVFKQLQIEKPTIQDKGVIMKKLMPLVSGKADGKLVNQLVSESLS